MSVALLVDAAHLFYCRPDRCRQIRVGSRCRARNACRSRQRGRIPNLSWPRSPDREARCSNACESSPPFDWHNAASSRDERGKISPRRVERHRSNPFTQKTGDHCWWKRTLYQGPHTWIGTSAKGRSEAACEIECVEH